MIKRDLVDYVSDILESINDVQEFTNGMSFEEFLKDKRTIKAVIRSLEVMGEAARNMPDEERIKYPKVPWKRMVGMRDKLVHGYSGVDLEIVWAVVKEELPPVKSFVEKVLAELKKSDNVPR